MLSYNVATNQYISVAPDSVQSEEEEPPKVHNSHVSKRQKTFVLWNKGFCTTLVFRKIFQKFTLCTEVKNAEEKYRLENLICQNMNCRMIWMSSLKVKRKWMVRSTPAAEMKTSWNWENGTKSWENRWRRRNVTMKMLKQCCKGNAETRAMDLSKEPHEICGKRDIAPSRFRPSLCIISDTARRRQGPSGWRLVRSFLCLIRTASLTTWTFCKSSLTAKNSPLSFQLWVSQIYTFLLFLFWDRLTLSRLSWTS